MTSFQVIRKKTPFQKHKEEEEARKKREEQEAASFYNEFVESFQADDTPGSKAFVRGGTINPNEKSRPGESNSAKKPGSKYVPSFMPPGLAAASSLREMDKKPKEEPREKEQIAAPSRGAAKVRNIDFFMEELKREQEAREQRGGDSRQRDRVSKFEDGPDDMGGPRDPNNMEDGDPQTTNLYVGNLSPQVDENFLLRTFGRFGPIASVKIMWPRTDEEKRRQRMCGFVAFMRRNDAQEAKDEMQGVIVYEYELRIGWGKAVSLPASALPAPPPGQMAVRPKEFSVHDGESSSVTWSEPGGGAPPAGGITGQNSEVVVTPNIPDILVAPPEDPHLRHVIDSMAMYVLDDGCPFEQAIMERARGNPAFSFLFDLGSPSHTYYIWRLYSFAQGDTTQRWRTEPFIMITGSGRWVPPPLPQGEAYQEPAEREKPSGTTFAAGRGRRGEQERALTDSQRDAFEDMLRALTLERSHIRQAMAFALDNAEAASEVVEVLTESLTLLETPVPSKVARLMLVSDILHNSSAPVKNASAYRTSLQQRLPDIMESFHDLYISITGRITAEALKERVMKVLQVWSDWFLFSEAYVAGLRATLLRPSQSGVTPFHQLPQDGGLEGEMGVPAEVHVAAGMESQDAPSGETGRPDGVDEGGQDAALAIGEEAAAAELAALPMMELERRCRHNGLSTRGGRQVMVARLLSLEEAERAKHQSDVLAIASAEETEGIRLVQKVGTDSTGLAARAPGKGRAGWVDVTAGGGNGWVEVSREEKPSLGSKLGDGKVKAESSGEDQQRKERDNHGLPPVIGPLSGKLLLPTPELHAFGGKSEMAAVAVKVEKKDVLLPASKWTKDDDEEEDGEGAAGRASDQQAAQGLGLEYGSDEDRAPGGNEEDAIASNDTSADEEMRQKKRKLELAVMEFRESLEAQGNKPFEVEVKTAAHRHKLEAAMAAGTWPVLLSSRGNKDAVTRGGGSTAPLFDKSLQPPDKGSLEPKAEGKDVDGGREVLSAKKRNRSRSRSKSRSRSSSPRRSRAAERERVRDRDRGRDREEKKDKEKERDRDRTRDREWDRDRDRLREKDRMGSGRKSSRTDRDREDRDRSRKDHDRGSDRNEKDRERAREKEKDRERDRSRDKRSRRS